MVEVVYERCCGLDVHQKTVVACLITPGAGGQPSKEIRTFGTMTADLLVLGDWLRAADCRVVALESTGVYWKPLWNVLEDEFTLLLVNARHIKAVPGRKTDVKDCEWLADLLRHGLVRASFVPDRPQRELRELTRYRTALVQERTAEVNRLHKTLEGGNLKLGAVASNVVGLSGRQILAALLGGTTDPAVLADLARGKLRAKLPELERALAGRAGLHQHFLLARQLAHIDFLDETLAQVSAEIAERLRPFEATIERLDAIPGVGRATAEVLLAEIGADMSRFPSAGHLASWAGMCPGNYESAGKRQKGKTRKGSKWLRAALVEAGRAAARKQHTYLAAQYHRLVPRLGKKKAAVAVGHSILCAVYYLLQRETTYQELGPAYFDERRRSRVERRLVRGLEKLGYAVTLSPKDPAA
jgi:transposase